MAKKSLLVLALLVAGFATLLLYLWVSQVEEEVAVYTTDEVEVVTASRDIPAGTPLTPNRITTKMVPQRFLPANPLMKRDAETIYIGTPVARDIKAGDMILTSDFAVAEMARTLAGRVPVGERAMSVQVDVVSGVSGLLKPGDRVDILATFPVGSEDELIPGPGGGMGYITITLLQNVTLLATGQQISNIGAEENARQGQTYGTVTMSLTIDEAELMVIAQTRANITLLLRNREDIEIGEIKKQTLREVMEGLEVLHTKRVEREKEASTRPRTRAPAAPRPCEPGQVRDASGKCVSDLEIIRGTDRPSR